MSTATTFSGPPTATFRPRIHRPSVETTDVSHFTLRDAFNAFLLQELERNDRSGSLEAYRNALKHWETLTENWELSQITTAKLDEFRYALGQSLAPATQAKILRQIRPILRRCGPQSEGNPRGEGLIPSVPWVQTPRVGRRAPRVATRDELNALYDACRVATWPILENGTVSAPSLWRALIVAFYNLGARAWEMLWDGEIIRLGNGEYGSLGWRFDRLLPYGKSAKGTDIQSIAYFQRKHPDELLVPVHPVLAAHLQAIRGERGPIFQMTKAHGSTYNQWKAIKAVAGIGVEGRPDLTFHDLRRTCQTNWDWFKLGAGDFIVGHANQDVGGKFYRHFERNCFEHVEEIPQPESFLKIFAETDGQKRLF